METDDDLRQLSGLKPATSFRIHVAYPVDKRPGAVGRRDSWRQQRRHELQTKLAQAGCDAYSITDVLGCWEHHAERGLVVERIYPEGRTAIPRGFAQVAKELQEDWKQEEVWVTRTELELAVIS